MFRSVREKYDYNKRRGGLFSSGYCFGVTLYNDYVKSDKPLKKSISEFIDSAHENARGGEEFSKGVMSAYRDMARVRSGKYKF